MGLSSSSVDDRLGRRSNTQTFDSLVDLHMVCKLHLSVYSTKILDIASFDGRTLHGLALEQIDALISKFVQSVHNLLISTVDSRR